MFEDDFVDYVRERRSVSGYQGKCIAHCLYWDIDNEDISKSYKDTQELCKRLTEQYSVSPDELLVYFSGNKGFHVVLPSEDIAGIGARSDTNLVVKHVCSKIATGIESFDDKVYDKMRIFRIPNSRHSSTNKFKVLLDTLSVLEGIPIVLIYKAAGAQVKRHGDISLSSNYMIKELIYTYNVEDAKQDRASKSTDSLIERLNNISSGDRNSTIASVAGLLHSKGIGDDVVLSLMSAVNKQCSSPLPDREVETIVKSISRYSVSREFRVTSVNDIKTMGEAAREWLTVRNSSKAISTGYSSLDAHLSAFDPGQVLLVAARAGVGKTTICMRIGQNIAENLGGTMLFTSLEMSAATVFHRAATMTMNSGVAEPLDKSSIAHSLITDASAREGIINAWDKTLIVDKSGLSLPEIGAYYKEAQELTDNRCEVLLVDYVGLIRGGGDYEGISEIARELKNMAKDLNTRIILCVQLSRKAGDGTMEPQMDHLRDSGALEEAADYVLGMWRSASDRNRIHGKFMKDRYSEIGESFDFISCGLDLREVEYEEDGSTFTGTVAFGR
jgi:KaiC/GvpD/RAD55 family RecA-like ATPase